MRVGSFFQQMARLAPLGCALFCLKKTPSHAFDWPDLVLQL